jgi:hypothetical protein
MAFPTTPIVYVFDSPPTTPRSYPIDIKVPDAPKKNIADRIGLATSESYSVDEFLRTASSFEPAEAVISSGNDDLEDTASSAPPLPKKKNIFIRAYNAIKSWGIEHQRIGPPCPCRTAPTVRVLPLGHFPEL